MLPSASIVDAAPRIAPHHPAAPRRGRRPCPCVVRARQTAHNRPSRRDGRLPRRAAGGRCWPRRAMRREDSGASAAPPWVDATHSCLKSAASCLAGKCARSRRGDDALAKAEPELGRQHQHRDSSNCLTSRGVGGCRFATMIHVQPSS